MPRYRFRWERLPTAVLRRLHADLGLPSGDPAAALRHAFGARPDEDFVRLAWPSLREGWLGRNAPARRAVVSALRARGLGRSRTAAPVEGDLDYLRSCRNSPGLRRVVLQHLLAAGADPAAPGRPGRSGSVDSSREELIRLVDAALAPVLGQVRHDDDGDVPIAFDNATVFVRVLADVPVVSVFSLVLRVKGSLALLEAINDHNRTSRFGRAFYVDDTVVLVAEVPGAPLVPEHLRGTCQWLGATADRWGRELTERFGGKTMGEAPTAPAPAALTAAGAGTGGYL